MNLNIWKNWRRRRRIKRALMCSCTSAEIELLVKKKKNEGEEGTKDTNWKNNWRRIGCFIMFIWSSNLAWIIFCFFIIGFRFKRYSVLGLFQFLRLEIRDYSWLKIYMHIYFRLFQLNFSIFLALGSVALCDPTQLMVLKFFFEVFSKIIHFLSSKCLFFC